MKVRSIRQLAATVTLAAASAVWAAAPAAAERQKVNIAFVVVDEDPLAQAMHVMADYIERSIPGRFDVEVYPGSTLFKQTQQIPAMQRGQLEIGYVNMFDVAPVIPEASILTAGYLIRDVEHHCTVLNSEFGQSLLANIEEKLGIVTLGQALIGKRTLVLRKARDVTSPADLSDITMREVGNEAFQFLAEALGARPTPIAYSELYLAMQTGTVDAFAGFSTAMENTKFYEVAEQLVRTEHLLSVDLIGVSKVFWDTLSEPEKAVVREAAAAASVFATNNRLRAEETALERLSGELGMIVSAPDVTPFREYMRDKYLNSKFADAWPDGLFDEISAMPSEPGCSLTVSD